MGRDRAISVKNKVTVRLSPLSVTRLKELAAANGRAVSAEAKEAIEFYLDNLEALTQCSEPGSTTTRRWTPPRDNFASHAIY